MSAGFVPSEGVIPQDVAGVVAGFPDAAQDVFARLRGFVFEAAAERSVGPLEETLKWGEPAYLTTRARTGTTVRLAWKARKPDHFQVLFHCGTRMIDMCRTRFPDMAFAGNRAILIPLDMPLPEDALRACFGLSLTYNQEKPV